MNRLLGMVGLHVRDVPEEGFPIALEHLPNVSGVLAQRVAAAAFGLSAQQAAVAAGQWA